MTDRLSQMLSRRPWLLADGATGTNLFALGLQHGDAPELWNLEEPAKVRAHYRSFLEAGSDLVLTNTFGGTRNRLKLHGLEGRVREINAAAARLLREEIAAGGREALCAGDVGPTGDILAPVGELSHADAVAAFAEQMEGLAEGGADLIWIETLSSEEELAAALEAAAGVGLPVVATMSFDTNGRTMMGVTPARLARIVHASPHAPAAWGGNCGTGAPDLLVGLLSAAAEIGPGDVLVTKANCGVPQWVAGEVRYSGTEALMADYAALARDMGVRIIGGCCGTTPAHVAAMRAALETRAPGPAPDAAEVVARLGPCTGATMELLEGPGAGAEGGGAGAGGRRAGRARRRG